ncbi:MAG: PAS domain S-box protein, partial [Rhodocyclaceae bacterium]|nr:PAS domain S-box protein [Rhodocyclaceae bacterium]
MPVSYGIAFIVAAVAAGARVLIGPADEGLTLVAFFPAVALAALLGGFWAGALALAVSALAAAWLSLPAAGAIPFGGERAALALNLAFMGGGLLVCGAIGIMHERYLKARGAAERFREVHDFLHAVVEGTSDMLFVKDRARRYVHCNGALLRALGKRLDEVVRRDDFSLFPAATARRLAGDDAKVMATGTTVTYEETVTLPDGKERNFLVTKGPVYASSGRIAGVFGVARDISERQRAAAALRESEQRFNALAEAAQKGIAITARGIVLDVNERLTDILGYERDEIVGRNLVDFIALSPAEGEWVAARIFAGLEMHGEHEVLRKDGSRRHVEINGKKLSDTDDGMHLTAIRDITLQRLAADEHRAAKAEAERANAAKSRFLAAASHDLRQPLSALSLYVGALEGRLAPADGQLVANMRDCVANLSEMLSDLLDLSKLDAGVVRPNVCDFALEAVLAKVASSHAPEAKLKGLALRYGYVDGIGRTDPVLFQRIVGNLVSNAIRYTERGGVLIACRWRQGKRWIEVWDTGIGIAADKTAEVFEEFRQLGNYERNRAKGSGLGLAIVAKTAALLGLQVRVHSRPGKGSVFAVELPPGDAVEPVVARRYTHRALRIALVEDNDEVATALAYALTEIGHQVVAGASREELLPRLGGIAPDIVISDYRLAGAEDGFAVIGALRAAFGSDLPALIITGDTDPAVIRRMTDQHISVQHKPLDLEALRTRIAALT